MNKKHGTCIWITAVMAIIATAGFVLKMPIKLPAKHITTREIDLIIQEMRAHIDANAHTKNTDSILTELTEKHRKKKDGWNQFYIFHLTNESTLSITSAGQDREIGTPDDITRIINLN